MVFYGSGSDCANADFAIRSTDRTGTEASCRGRSAGAFTASAWTDGRGSQRGNQRSLLDERHRTSILLPVEVGDEDSGTERSQQPGGAVANRPEDERIDLADRLDGPGIPEEVKEWLWDLAIVQAILLVPPPPQN